MSYDLMAFDSEERFLSRDAFMQWYDHVINRQDEPERDDPDISTPALRDWFLDIIKEYPPMNGPYASGDVDNPKMTDYSIGRSSIYAAFAWSQSEAARQTVFALARKHKVGFFDVSSEEGGIWMPQADGTYACIDGSDAQNPENPGSRPSKRRGFLRKK